MSKIKQIKEYGFLMPVSQPEDYCFGSSLPYEELQPDGDWTPYLPTREFQNLNGIEPYACVSYTILNQIEIYLKRKFGVERNYSDRFLAAISGTKDKRGNDPKVVYTFLRKIGAVAEEKYPNDAKDFEDYYKEIPSELKTLAEDFLNEWNVEYEFVPANHDLMARALKCSPLLFSVYAWVEKDGFFYKPQGVTDNHATTLIYQRPGVFRRMFDTYDSPHLKDVAWDAMPMYCSRIYITKSNRKEQLSAISKIIQKIMVWLGLIQNDIQEIKKQQEAPVVVSIADALVAKTKDYIGKDSSPKDMANDEFGCAESVSNILREVIPEFRGEILSTADLYRELKKNPRFQATLTPKAGCVVVSPRTATVNGHTGIFIDSNNIVSNDSNTGLMQLNYTWDKWIKTFQKGRGLKIYLFEVIN